MLREFHVRKYTDLFFLLLLLSLGLWFYRNLFWYIIGDDAIIHRYPFAVHIARALSQGEFPLWNPFSWSGTPFVADISVDIWYPLNLLYAFFPTAGVFKFFHLFHIVLGGWAVYFLARVCRVSPWGCAVSGIIFLLGPVFFQTIYAGYFVYTTGLPYLPLILAFHLLALRRNQLGLSALAGGMLGLQILGSSVQVGGMSILILVVNSVYYLWRSRDWRLEFAGVALKLATIFAIGFMLGMVKLLPFLYYLKEGMIAHGIGNTSKTMLAHLRSIYDGSSFGLSPFAFLRFLFPDAHGATTWPIYIGAAPLVLVVLGLIGKREENKDKALQFFLVLFIVGIVISLGLFSPFQWIVYWLPGGQIFRRPERFLYISMLGIAILAGYGTDALMGNPEKCRVGLRRLWQNEKLKWITAILVVFNGVGLYISKWLSPIVLDRIEGLWRDSETAAIFGEVAPIATTSREALEGLKGAVGGQIERLFYLPDIEPFLFGSISLGLIFSVIVGSGKYLRKSAIGWAVLVTIVANSAFLHSLQNFSPDYRNEPDLYFADDSNIYKWLRNDKDIFRVLCLSPDITYHQPSGMVRLNQGMVSSFESLGGIDNYIDQDYLTWMKLLNGIPLDYQPYKPFEIRLQSLEPDIVNLLNIKYAISSDSIADANLSLVSTDSNGLILYRNERFYPRVNLVYDWREVEDQNAALEILQDEAFDFRSQVVIEGHMSEYFDMGEGIGSATMVRRSINEIAVDIETTKNALLVLSEVYTSGWEATLDGDEVEVLRGNSFMRVVPVPIGKHHLAMRFRPHSAIAGGTMTFVGLCAMFLLLWKTRQR